MPYRAYEVCGMAAFLGGLTIGQTLSMLAHYDIATLAPKVPLPGALSATPPARLRRSRPLHADSDMSTCPKGCSTATSSPSGQLRNAPAWPEMTKIQVSTPWEGTPAGLEAGAEQPHLAFHHRR